MRQTRLFRNRPLRTKREGAWEGLYSGALTMTAGTAQFAYMWSDVSSSDLNAPERLLHRISYLTIQVNPTAVASGTGCLVGWYVMAVSTDVTNDVPAALLWSPLSTATFAQRKGVLARGVFGFGNSTGAASYAVLPYQGFENKEIKAKRKLSNEDALVIVYETSVNVNAGLYLQTRTYCSW